MSSYNSLVIFFTFLISGFFVALVFHFLVKPRVFQKFLMTLILALIGSFSAAFVEMWLLGSVLADQENYLMLGILPVATASVILAVLWLFNRKG